MGAGAGITVTILGCGSSTGVPMIGCDCAVCTSDNPKNKRSRVSVLVESAEGKRLLIDTSPDLYHQAIAAKIKTVDAIFYTHAHADHTHGIDDTRSFCYHAQAPIPVYADAPTLADLKTRFGFRFRPAGYDPAVHHLDAHEVAAGQRVMMAGMEVELFTQAHGKGTSLGIRIGNFVYSTDANGLDDALFDGALKDVDVWVVDCLKRGGAPTHATLEQSLGWIARAKPQMAYLTHMSHSLDYDQLKAELPANIEPAYDGLRFIV